MQGRVVSVLPRRSGFRSTIFALHISVIKSRGDRDEIFFSSVVWRVLERPDWQRCGRLCVKRWGISHPACPFWGGYVPILCMLGGWRKSPTSAWERNLCLPSNGVCWHHMNKNFCLPWILCFICSHVFVILSFALSGLGHFDVQQQRGGVGADKIREKLLLRCICRWEAAFALILDDHRRLWL